MTAAVLLLVLGFVLLGRPDTPARVVGLAACVLAALLVVRRWESYKKGVRRERDRVAADSRRLRHDLLAPAHAGGSDG